MSKPFRVWDIEQDWLLPRSVHEFVPPGHLAHFVRDTVREALEYVEFDVDADQNPQIFFDLKGCVQTVQVQIQAGTIGATPAEVTTAFYAASK